MFYLQMMFILLWRGEGRVEKGKCPQMSDLTDVSEMFQKLHRPLALKKARA